MRTVFVLLCGLFLFSACRQPPADTTVIHLAQLEPLPEEAPTEILPLRVAIAAVISPRGTLDSYGPLLEYLSEALQRPVELVQRRTYTEVNELVRDGEVDLAFVCTSAYVVGAREFDMQLLVAPQVKGETVYYSLLIVPADSDAESIVDLEGEVFAFTDPMSNTGRNYPTYLVQQLGSSPEQFFSRTFFTYSHDDAIRAVANHVADGAAVDSLVYAYAVENEPELANRTRIIHQSPAFGIPPVVVGPHVRPQGRAELATIFLQMNARADGQSALKTAGIDRFVIIEDAAYQSVRALESQLFGTP